MPGFLHRASEPAVPLLLALLLSLPTAALAEEAGRFVLKEADQNTFIRLDTVTGAVAHCASKAGDWICRTLADDRRALHDEIAALKAENAELKSRAGEMEKLKKENAALKSRLAQRETKTEPRLALPSEQDIDRVMALFEKYFARLWAFIRQLEERQSGKAI